MSTPIFTCQVAFATNPGSAPTWTDVTPYLLEFQIQRGRQKELARIDGGHATFRFNNSDRRFDPTHTGSPYYPNVLPMRRIRLTALHNAVTYYLFAGYVDAWPQIWQGPLVGFSDIQASDGFRPLSSVDVGTGVDWPDEFSGARIGRTLDAAGWPAADRALDAGYSSIIAANYPLGSGVTALGHIQEVADSELGIFFVDGQGRATFQDRHHRRGASYLTSQAIFGDALSGGLPYQEVVLDTDDARIWNDVQIVTPASTAQQAQDATSQTTYLRRTLARSVPLSRVTEAADQAAYLLSLYKDPHYLLSSIRVIPTTDALWVQTLGREIGDHITVKRWPQGVGSQIVQQCGIESLSHHGAPGIFETTWLLSTIAFTTVDWWLLGDATYGLEGTTTKLVY